MKLRNWNFLRTVEWTENVSDEKTEKNICSLLIVSFQLALEVL